MAISRLSGQDARGTGAGSATATYPGVTTAGNLLVATVMGNIGTDSLAITGWTKGVHFEVGTNNSAIFYKLADGTETTVTVTGSSSSSRIHIYEYSGNANPIVTDGSNSAQGASGTSVTGPSITTTNANDLLVATTEFSGTVTTPAATAPFGGLQADAASIRLFDADQIVAATGSYACSFTWTTAAVPRGCIIAFKAAVAPVAAAGGLPTLTVELEDGSGNFTNDVSAFCHLPSGVDLTRGRVDEQTDVTSGEVTLLLHNLDGRFTLGSASYNGITVDKRIRITETYSSTVFRRFVGYVQEWPTQWASGVANLAYAAITAIDRQARLARRKLLNGVTQEFLADLPLAMYQLDEPEGSTAAGDTSGHGDPTLTLTGDATLPVVFGSPSGLAAISSGVAFQNGQFLTGGRVPASAGLTLEAFFNLSAVPAAGAVIAQLPDVTGYVFAGLVLAVNNTGHLNAFAIQGSASGPSVATPGLVTDGLTHHAAVTFDGTTVTLYLDGVSIGSTSVSTTANLSSVLNVGGGTYPATTAPFLASQPSVFDGTIALVVVTGSVLSAARIAAHATAGLTGFASDRADQRVARLAGYANIATADQNLETGQQASIGPQDTDGVSVLDAMRAVVQAEGGLLFVSGDGKLTMQNKNHRVLKATAAPAVTLTADQVDPKSLTITGDKDYLFNTGTGTGISGAQQRVVNAASVAKYEEYDVQRDAALLADELLLNQLQWLTTMYGDPTARVSALTLNLLVLPAATVSALLALELGDLVRLSSLPTQSPATSLDLLVEGSKESLTESSWTLTLNTVPAPAFRAWVLDDTTYSVLDSTTRLYF